MTTSRSARPPRDWDAIRAAVARPDAARTPEQARAIMDARARKLAARPDIAAGAQLVLAMFELAGERYAVELRWLHEVTRVTAYTPVPGTPEHLVGLTSVRGDVFAVFDLRRLLGLAASGVTDRTRLVLLGDQAPELGVLMDRALGTTALPVARVLPAAPGVAGGSSPWVRGVTDDAMVILDGGALLLDPRLVIDQTQGT